MKKIIVTGGLGFIGSNLIELLIKKKYFVINIDKDYPEGILLSEVLRIIKDDNRGPISLHLLCCMDIEPKAYYKEENYSKY